MLYESQGIFPERWAFDFGQEARSVTHQHATSARSRTPKAKREADCQECGKSFVPTKGAVGKYCSHACMHKGRIKSRPIGFECSRCLSTVGIGMAVASRLLGVTKSSIHRSWNREGIRAQLPKGVDSWRQYAQRARSPVHGWWGNPETAAMWISEYSPRFPDWSAVWQKDQQNKKAMEDYNSAESQYIRSCNQDIRRHTLKSIYPDWSSLWSKSRMSYTPQARAKDNLRTRLKVLMKTARKGGANVKSSFIGCTTEQLAKHLEAGFTKRMSWKNYGTYWHVDHVLPCALFDHTDAKQVAQCWHWTNLRALEAKKNMEKSDTITEPQMNLLLCATC